MRVRATTTRKEEPTVATDISIALEELLDKTGADVLNGPLTDLDTVA